MFLNYQESTQSEILLHLRRNYLVHSVEGGLYIGGLAFIAAETILPRMIEFLRGPAWLISLMPMLMGIGFGLPPILTAHKIEKLQWVKPLVVFTGVFQRLPFLLAALALLYLADGHQIEALTIIALSPLLSGLIGGMSSTAWQELIIKTVPENRRSSLFAIRFVISSSIGIGAGGIIAGILSRFPGTFGFGILHLIAFGFMVLSYFIFMLIRETNCPAVNDNKRVSLKQNLQEIPRLINRSKGFRCHLWSCSLLNTIFIMTPFLAIHALRVTEKADSFLGFLVTSQMVGGITGNMLSGILGDRYGGRIVLFLSRVLFIVVCIWASLTRSEWAFIIIFFIFGAAFFANQVGISTLNLEICPHERRSTYLAILALINVPTQIGASLISATIWKATENFPLLALLSAAGLCFSIMFLSWTQEPRNNHQS